ncbi:hypothetical protein RRG08_016550 [Elysia crispata]|uniref:Uncharacterized protein n=1 Tax=Elysia crispata TaxID=231223 RepID=A0AAE1D2G2_9GAST|nr:hypothetical protein RRG08_016550 [Elysia crispata]
MEPGCSNFSQIPAFPCVTNPSGARLYLREWLLGVMILNLYNTDYHVTGPMALVKSADVLTFSRNHMPDNTSTGEDNRRRYVRGRVISTQ